MSKTMAKNFDFRPLRADEVMLRFKTFNTKDKDKATSAIYLLYKDARCDMRILDENFGTFGWSREHHWYDGKLYCSVSIKNEETGEWVTKDDAGEETQVEATKGEASDAFKRACFNWGIGRELYTGPKIEIPFQGQYETAHKAHYNLYISELVVEDHRIKKLVIRDKFNERFSWTAPNWTPAAAPAQEGTTVKVPSKSEAMKAIERMLPKCENAEALKALWATYPLYQNDVEFSAKFTARKKELGL